MLIRTLLFDSTTPDTINAAFELFGSVFTLGHCAAIWRDKVVKGVSIPAVVFFTLWGGWNLYYYPHLGQWLSFAGGVALVIANSLYVGLLLWYHKRSVTISQVLQEMGKEPLKPGEIRELTTGESAYLEKRLADNEK